MADPPAPPLPPLLPPFVPPQMATGFRFPIVPTFTPSSPQSLPYSAFRPSLDSYSQRRSSLPLSPLSPIIASPPSGGNGPGISFGSEDSSGQSEEGTFYQRLKIEIKQPVGNMSISPSNRDVVLASRKGLFIIDLDHPYEEPRFLPQGGTWEVADVQWNPHRTRSEYIVSTSSQKLLIWNLYKGGQTSIEHILNKHYRAITDINWSAFNPDVIASCGIDSWIWAWDLRQGPQTIFGMCAWDAPATQVKWNRRDQHMIASSHDDKVLIWDDRKGSLPLLTIPAHSGAKIYGIDWSRKYRNEIVTCSLDRTIKFWRVDGLARQPEDAATHDSLKPNPASLYPKHEFFDTQTRTGLGTEDPLTPRAIIRTRYPVWRARHLPFGYGVMSLPQRSENSLEMFTPEKPEQPIWTAEGHDDVVKEYVWRWRGGSDLDNDDREFQLITWSKDRTLRLWPIESETLRAAGHVPGGPIQIHLSRRGDQPSTSFSFRIPREKPVPHAEIISAPMNQRSILAGVQAGMHRESSLPHPPPTPARKGTPTESAPGDSPERSRRNLPRTLPTPAPPVQQVEEENIGRPTLTSGYMTRGAGTMRPTAPISGADHLARFTSVTVEKRSGSGGVDSGPTSRITSRSRAASVDARDILPGEGSSTPYAGLPTEGPFGPGAERGRTRGRSDSRVRGEDTDMPEHLADEIALVGRKFGTRVACERADVQRKRTCTFTLLGPWRDDNALTFIRITFWFPKDYWKYGIDDPNATRSLPYFDLDKIAGISLKTRAFLLKKIRNIRFTHRPCLEPCLRFLLGEDEERGYGFRGAFGMSEGSRSDGEDEDATADVDLATTVGTTRKLARPSDDHLDSQGRPGRAGLQVIRNTPENSIRPVRCGGSFGPNGELVCFFLNTPTRIFPRGTIGTTRRNASPSPSLISRATSGNYIPRQFSSTAGTISHAMRGLSRLTNDNSGLPLEPQLPRIRKPWTVPGLADSIFLGPVLRSTTRDSRDTRASSNHAGRDLSSVSVRWVSEFIVLDKLLAKDYSLDSMIPSQTCKLNSGIARAHGRPNHERVWNTLYGLFCPTVPLAEDDGSSTIASIATFPAHQGQGPYEVVADGRGHVKWGDHPLAKATVKAFYDIFAQKRDLQMLAMLSVVLLEVDRHTPQAAGRRDHIEIKQTIPNVPVIPILPVSPRIPMDYFSLRPRGEHSPATPSPSWPHRLSSYASQTSLASPASRSWAQRFLSTSEANSPPLSTLHLRTRERTVSSISTTLSSQDSPRLSVVSDVSVPGMDLPAARSTSIPVPVAKVPVHEASPRKKGYNLLSGLGSKSSEGPLSVLKTWSEPTPGPSSAKLNIMFSSTGYGKRWLGGGSAGPRSTTARNSLLSVKEKKKTISVTLQADDEERMFYHSPLAQDIREQKIYEGHIIAYAEVLFRWQLLGKRLELLKHISRAGNPDQLNGVNSASEISVVDICTYCHGWKEVERKACQRCRGKAPRNACSICRLFVPGLAHRCLTCGHITHAHCWKAWRHIQCPTGCGCNCHEAESEITTPRNPEYGAPDPLDSSLDHPVSSASVYEAGYGSELLSSRDTFPGGYQFFQWGIRAR